MVIFRSRSIVRSNVHDKKIFLICGIFAKPSKNCVSDKLSFNKGIFATLPDTQKRKLKGKYLFKTQFTSQTRLTEKCIANNVAEYEIFFLS